MVAWGLQGLWQKEQGGIEDPSGVLNALNVCHAEEFEG